MNKTLTDRDNHHHHDENAGPKDYLHVVNSSVTVAKVLGIESFTNFTVTVYLVEKNHDIHKSNEIRVLTDEGGE